MYPAARYALTHDPAGPADALGDDPARGGLVVRAVVLAGDLAGASATPETLWHAAARVDRFAAELEAQRAAIEAATANLLAAKEVTGAARLVVAELDTARRIVAELRRIAAHAAELHAAGLEGGAVARLTRAAVAAVLTDTAGRAAAVHRHRRRRLATVTRVASRPRCAHAPPAGPVLDRVTATTSTA